MLKPEEVDALQDACGFIADSNWDCAVGIVQKDDGTLIFTMVNDEDVTVATWTATPVGVFDHIGWCKTLYLFKDEKEPRVPGWVITLVAPAICGLLGLDS